LRGGSGLKSDRLADHKGHGFSFGFADLFGGKSAAVAPVQNLMRDLSLVIIPSAFEINKIKI